MLTPLKGVIDLVDAGRNGGLPGPILRFAHHLGTGLYFGIDYPAPNAGLVLFDGVVNVAVLHI